MTRRERDWALLLAARTVHYEINPVVRDRPEPEPDNRPWQESLIVPDLGTAIDITHECCRPGDMTNYVMAWVRASFVEGNAGLIHIETEPTEPTETTEGRKGTGFRVHA
jgi:hypothetical protein